MCKFKKGFNFTHVQQDIAILSGLDSYTMQHNMDVQADWKSKCQMSEL